MIKKHMHKRAIALLITVMFIMLITLSVGVSLKYIQSASKDIKSEHFVFQSSMVLDDILNILQNYKELNKVDSPESLDTFLSSYSTMVFESNGVKIAVEFSSARGKVNPNSLVSEERLDIFKSFLLTKMINVEYADMLSDLIGGIKEDGTYKTNIFDKNPYLFRSYVASDKHLDELGDIYTKVYHDRSIENLDTRELFYVVKDKNSSADGNYSIDVNYATPVAWELMLGCDEERANVLSMGGVYETVNDLDLSDDENISLSKFKVSSYEPYIDVQLDIYQNQRSVSIRFEYNIILKKGSNFVYEV